MKIDKKEYNQLLKFKEKYYENKDRIEYLSGIIQGFKDGRDYTDKIYEKVLSTLINMNDKCKN